MKNSDIFFIIIIIVILYLIKINSNKLKENFSSLNQEEIKNNVINKVNKYRTILLYQSGIESSEEFTLTDSINYLGQFANNLKEKISVKNLKVNKLILYSDDFKGEYKFEIKNKKYVHKNKKYVHVASSCNQCEPQNILCGRKDYIVLSQLEFDKLYVIGEPLHKLIIESKKGCDNINEDTKFIKIQDSDAIYVTSTYTPISTNRLNISKNTESNGNIYISNSIQCDYLKNISKKHSISINNKVVIDDTGIKSDEVNVTKEIKSRVCLSSTIYRDPLIKHGNLRCGNIYNHPLGFLITDTMSTNFKQSILEKYYIFKNNDDTNLIYRDIDFKKIFKINNETDFIKRFDIYNNNFYENPLFVDINFIQFAKVKDSNEPYDQHIYLIITKNRYTDIKIDNQIDISDKFDVYGPNIDFVKKDIDYLYGRIYKDDNKKTFNFKSYSIGDVTGIGLFKNNNNDKTMDYNYKKNKNDTSTLIPK
jgi:hypothetical protein